MKIVPEFRWFLLLFLMFACSPSPQPVMEKAPNPAAAVPHSNLADTYNLPTPVAVEEQWLASVAEFQNMPLTEEQTPEIFADPQGGVALFRQYNWQLDEDPELEKVLYFYYRSEDGDNAALRVLDSENGAWWYRSFIPVWTYGEAPPPPVLDAKHRLIVCSMESRGSGYAAEETYYFRFSNKKLYESLHFQEWGDSGFMDMDATLKGKCTFQGDTAARVDFVFNYSEGGENDEATPVLKDKGFYALFRWNPEHTVLMPSESNRSGLLEVWPVTVDDVKDIYLAELEKERK